MDIPTDDRHHRGMFGISIDKFNLLYFLVNESNHKIKKHLYWTLFFLHNYPIQDNMEVIFQKDHKPLMKWIWCVIYIINLAVNRGRPSPLPLELCLFHKNRFSRQKSLSRQNICFCMGKIHSAAYSCC